MDTKQETLAEVKARHAKEFYDFPMAFAFNDKQLAEALEKLGVTIEECTSIPGGGIIRKADRQALIDLIDRQKEEMKAARRAAKALKSRKS